ncbi:MAG: hypothetical protein EPN57_08650 [Paraburkholderia sp.]|nr:MAG: hypothetical protein EPN57_08650 [Paraburkholderia sp.]
MDDKANLINRLRAAAKLACALVERDAVRKAAPGNRPEEVAARLRANHDLRMVALRVIDTNHRKP